MGQIKVLDQNMVNMIAAGEVIERPASVVKELMENSIDAGATKITVSVEDGGRRLISAADNGCGMDADDLERALESHTTSKIKTTLDLQHISTLGFRGEALASIASVAHLHAVSRTKDSMVANCIEADCGKKGVVNPCSADYGTTIQVRDLFYKMPARRKFLRTANTEMTHIIEQFTRIALANCGLDMTLIHNGKELYRLSAENGLLARIAGLFSSEIADNFIEAQSSERPLQQDDKKGMHIFALLGKPAISRTDSRLQYIFLNGRFIRDKFISHAIKEAYRGSIEPSRFPVVFLFIRMPCEDYDVNVHPTKIEVRFYNANLVHSQILGVLREKLLGTDLDVGAKLPTAAVSYSSTHGRQVAEAMAEFFKKHRPVQSQQQIEFRRAHQSPARHTESENYPRYDIRSVSYERKFLQIHDSFIVTQTEDGFAVIDQHALHERIMYENLRKRIQKGRLESQRLLIPQSFEMTASQSDTVKNNTELIERLGIELTAFGPRTMAVQSFPALLAKVTPADFVEDLLDLLADKGRTLDGETLLDEVLNMAACKAAVKAGQKLTDSEMERLLADKELVASSGRCPHGRPTTIKFSTAELERQFRRT